VAAKRRNGIGEEGSRELKKRILTKMQKVICRMEKGDVRNGGQTGEKKPGETFWGERVNGGPLLGSHIKGRGGGSIQEWERLRGGNYNRKEGTGQ